MGKDKNTKIKNALISVSNKDQLELLTQSLNELGINIISTGGTASFIDNLGIKVKKVSDITGFPEIMDGRVKTLHPKIYGGLLNRKEIDDATQEEHSIQNIDLIIVNLYHLLLFHNDNQFYLIMINIFQYLKLTSILFQQLFFHVMHSFNKNLLLILHIIIYFNYYQ